MKKNFTLMLCCIALILSATTNHLMAKVPWNSNLLANPCCSNNNTLGWTVTNGTSEWSAENGYWNASYSFCKMDQTVNLLTSGFTAEELDAKPYLIISGRYYSYYSYRNISIKAYALNESGDTLQTITLIDSTFTSSIPWQSSLTYEVLPIGTRSVNFAFSKKDSKTTQGLCYTTFDDMWLSLSTSNSIPSFPISCATVERGSFNVDKTTAKAGDTIKITATPEVDYDLYQWNVKATSGAIISVANDSTFIMPFGYDVIVSGSFAGKAPFDLNAIVNKDSTVEISWKGYTEKVWNLVISTTSLSDPSTGDIITLDTSAYSFSSWIPKMTYYVYVQAIDKEKWESEWTKTNFLTGSRKLQCDQIGELTINMKDSYGDGWNGNMIYVEQNGVVMDVITMDDDYSEDAQILVCANDSTYLRWVSGSYSYETSFTISEGDSILYTCTDGHNLSDDTIFLHMPNCHIIPFPNPVDFSMTAYTKTSATLEWTGYGSKRLWNLIISDSVLTEDQCKAIMPIQVTDNFYTVENLTASHFYYAYIQAGEDEKNSKWISLEFHTDTIAPTFKAITLRHIEKGSFVENAQMIIDKGDTYLAHLYKLNTSDTTRIYSIFHSEEILLYKIILSLDSTFSTIIKTSNILRAKLLPDTTYYIALITDKKYRVYGDYVFKLLYESSYHSLDYSRELTLDSIEQGIFTEKDPFLITNDFSGHGIGYYMFLQKGHTYRFTLTSFAETFSVLSAGISLLTPDTLRGSYDDSDDDLLDISGIERENTLQESITMIYTADTTANYPILLQSWQFLEETGYFIKVEEIHNIETFTIDSLLCHATTLNYIDDISINQVSDLPYVTFGEFKVSDTPVRFDSLDNYYHAKAYRIEVPAGDSLIATLEGDIDSYMYLYTGNQQAGYKCIDDDDDDYGNYDAIIDFYATTDTVVYVVLSTYDPLEYGSWILHIVRSAVDLDIQLNTSIVTLIATPDVLPLSDDADEDIIKTALQGIQLEIVSHNETVGMILNNPYLWSINMENHTATFTSFNETLPLAYTFADDTSSITVTWGSATALSPVNNKSSLGIYPNPAEEICHVLTNATNGMLTIYDLTGRIVHTQSLSGTGHENVDVSSLNQGIYQIRIYDQVAKLMVK